MYAPFFAAVTKNDVRLRFFAPVKEFSIAFVARLDSNRLWARHGIRSPSTTLSGRMLGVVRLHANVINDTAEYAILVRSDLKGRGLGWLLMELIIDYAAQKVFKPLKARSCCENYTMLAMCRELGFDITADPNDVAIRIATYRFEKAEYKDDPGVLDAKEFDYARSVVASAGLRPALRTVKANSRRLSRRS